MQMDMGGPVAHPDLGGRLVLAGAGACTLRDAVHIGVGVVGQNEVIVLEVTCPPHPASVTGQSLPDSVPWLTSLRLDIPSRQLHRSNGMCSHKSGPPNAIDGAT